MNFVDEVTILVKAGDGGRGCVSFLREKFRPWGGPNGGNGGNGGHVILKVDAQRNTLLELAHRHHAKAGRGEHGRGKDQHGKNGKTLVLEVPAGTVVHDEGSHEQLADLQLGGKEVIVARGGLGGRGNASFATATNRAPRIAQPGRPGETRQLRLELQLLADVGLVGFPNVGKSTLISVISSARPKIAEFPFTTLAPSLGVVRVDESRSFVVADLPGLIEGAHKGQGLGTRFLRHLSRTSVLVHLIDLSDPERDAYQDYSVIRAELEAFDPRILKRPEIIVITKADLDITRQRFGNVRKAFARQGKEVRYLISSAARRGILELIKDVAGVVLKTGGADGPEEVLHGERFIGYN